jgi:hypothetical protein
LCNLEILNPGDVLGRDSHHWRPTCRCGRRNVCGLPSSLPSSSAVLNQVCTRPRSSRRSASSPP